MDTETEFVENSHCCKNNIKYTSEQVFIAITFASRRTKLQLRALIHETIELRNIVY